MVFEAGVRLAVRIEVLLASPCHRYDGRPADGAVPVEALGLPVGASEARDEVQLRKGLGIVGDRYFGKAAHRAASVTLLSADALDAVARELGRGPLDPLVTRRNIVVRGLDVDALRDLTFALDSGDGPVVLRGNRPANPCAWMDRELAPGAFAAMRGRGGLRCEPLVDGTLRLGPATFEVLGE